MRFQHHAQLVRADVTLPLLMVGGYWTMISHGKTVYALSRCRCLDTCDYGFTYTPVVLLGHCSHGYVVLKQVEFHQAQSHRHVY